MGTNNLETKNPGDVIAASDPNQYKTAVSGTEFVPRNSSGVPTDDAGGLGTTLYRWGTSYIKKIFFGTAAQECSIENDGTNLKFKIAGVLKALIDANGVDGQYMKTASVPDAALVSPRRRQVKKITTTGSGTVAAPSDIAWMRVLGAGAGGGGGGGGGGQSGNSGGGGAGGNGAIPGDVIVPITASEILSYTVPAGGTAGAGNSAAAGGNGGNGSAATLSGAGFSISFQGGLGGQGGSYNAGGTAGSGGDETVREYAPHGSRSKGGAGGDNCASGGSQNPGSAGDRSVTGTAGTGANGQASGVRSGGGGGGGGGAGYGNGGNGGAGTADTTNGAAGSAGTLSGGGGGGGGGSGSGGGAVTGGAGGAGGPGFLYLECITATAWEGTI